MTQIPKLIARSLEVNVTYHCNLSCYGCDHASPINLEGYLSIDELAGDLAALAAVYHVFEFRLTGGEPFLHPHLLDIVDTIRKSGIAEKIALITNGVLLHNAPQGLWDRIDKLVVSAYPGVKRKVTHDDLRALANRHGLVLWYKPTDEFTIKLLHAENTDREVRQAIYSTCTLKTSCHTIHHGRYFKCSPAPFIPDWLQRVGTPRPDWSGDSVKVRDNPHLRAELAEYLARTVPLEACGYCLGCVGKTTPSRQMTRVAAQQWVAEKDPDVHELIDGAALRAAQARNILGVDLTGVITSMRGLKLRWVAALAAARFLKIQLTGRPPTVIIPRLRAMLRRFVARPADQA